jgi:glycosyltransferase involved in cell wall biosynthesis
MPLVSVIIPTYNHRAYVLQTLDSVFAQTHTDREIIVVNDGSPDDTAAVLKPLANQGKIRYVEQANSGQATARNRGLNDARGQFVAFLDDDDLWPADKLAWQVQALQDNPDAALVYGRYESFYPDGAHYLCDNPLPAGDVWERLFHGNIMVSPGQALIRTEPLRALGGFNPRIWGCDDLDLWFRLSREHPFASVDRLALSYRVHATNASRNLAGMLLNTVRVFEAHLPLAPRPQRSRLRRAAIHWSYDYTGKKVLSDLRSDLRRRRWRAAAHSLPAAVRIGAMMLRDRDSRREFLRDILPRELVARGA